jgi:hypothetical protein
LIYHTLYSEDGSMTGEKHVLLTIGGTWSGSTDLSERWQIGIRCWLDTGDSGDKGALPTSWDITDDGTTHTLGDWSIETTWIATKLTKTFNPADWFNDQVIPAVNVFAAANSVPAHCLTDTVKANPIDAAGHVIGENFCLAKASPAVAGTLGGNLLPLQNSVVASWGTRVLGAKGRGRVYMPGVTANSITADGDLTPTAYGNQLNTAITLLEGIAFNGPLITDFSILPIVTGKPYVSYGIIRTVRVGSRVDTQRRRRRQLVEAYDSGAVTYP